MEVDGPGQGGQYKHILGAVCHHVRQRQAEQPADLCLWLRPEWPPVCELLERVSMGMGGTRNSSRNAGGATPECDIEGSTRCNYFPQRPHTTDLCICCG